MSSNFGKSCALKDRGRLMCTFQKNLLVSWRIVMLSEKSADIGNSSASLTGLY